MSVAQPELETRMVLIVEDEPDVATILARVVESCVGWRARVLTEATRLEEGLDPLPDLVFTDLAMPGADGFAVIERLGRLAPEVPVVVVSAYATLENAVRAVKAGAFDFLAKPFKPEAVELLLAKAERDLALRRRAQAADGDLVALLGETPAMRRVREWLRMARATNANVLIEGESGTGKELAARALHGRGGPFVAINAAAIPETLAEAELFGYRRGAFTGASRDHEGLLRAAHGGTLFLDEVNAMPLALQAKLLRVIEEKRVRPLGGREDLAVDFRLVCASNVPLAELVEDGRFRRDLFHRLKVLHLRLPPLRERREDIPLLATHFLERYARAHGRHCRRLAPEAIAALIEAEWPGNVRELENVIEQAVVLCPPSALELPLSVLPGALGGEGWFEPAADASASLSLAAVERTHVRRVLAMTGGNKSEAARLLGIDYKTLLRKLAERDA